jgi:excisionase family DNA binding protein
MAGPAEETLLLVRQVAAYFRVSEETVRDWLRTGRIRGRRTPGRQWRVFGSELGPFISDNAPGESGPEGTREIIHD